MRRSRSINQVVLEILFTRPQLLSALSMGVVNYSALARAIKSEVERRIGVAVSEAAVKVALIRFREQVTRSIRREDVMQVIAESTTTLVDDIGLVTVRLIDPLELLRFLSMFKARLLQITQGIRTLTIVADTPAIQQLLANIDRSGVEEVYLDQAAVMVESPKSIIMTPGVMAYMTLLLALHSVNITQVISTYTDTLFIVNREKAVEAYSLLRTAVEEARRILKKI